MNPSIFIAENNLSSSLVYAHKTLLWAHPRGLDTKCYKGLCEHIRGGSGKQKADINEKKEGKYKVGMMCRLEGGCLLYGSHT